MQRVRLLVDPNGLLRVARRCLTRRSNAALGDYYRQPPPSFSGGGSVVREAIAPEMVTIEILPAAEEHCGGSGNARGESTHDVSWGGAECGGGGAGGALQQKHYWDVTSIDNFAKSRVLNYVRRTGNQSADVFEVSREQMFGRTVYRARCKLLLPPPHNFYVAEGVGEDEKDAELLAAMHAERVCDAFGVPLFRLPSMQQKHAENARRQGRYAPMPGDPIKPENTIAPPPLRMVTAAPRGGPEAAATPTDTSSVFSTSITEAEIVDDRSRTGGGGLRAIKPEMEKKKMDLTVSPSASDAGAVTSTSVAEVDAMDSCGELPYHATVYYPWLSFTPSNNSGNVATSAGGGATMTTAAACFDPTEGGMWQMVNVNSTRCSPSPDALLLPCVYETAAHERLKDHFLQRGMALKDRITISHVAVAGHSARMYVAEIRLHDSIVSRGKAQTKECAEHLAAMHAELILDAIARPLFPKDDQRQAKHAAAVERFGRWAPNPLRGDTQHPRPHDALPLPLKQQVGGDEVWLDPQMLRRYGYQRSFGERIIAAHNEINNYCGDYIEANPDPVLLTEARQALEAWQRDIARNPCPDLFVITRMGEQFRASTLVPVPRAFGVRGGNAVGKTMEQAMDLCALHAVDTLCALGIPLFADPVRQQAFLEQRRRLGLVLADNMTLMPSEGRLVAIPASSLAEAESATACSAEKKTSYPYLPGYIVEGNQTRPLPHIRDTLHILQLRIPDDFAVYGMDLSDESIIEAGNDAKVCVQNYLRHHLPKNTNVNTSVYITGYGRQVSVHNIAYLPIVPPKPGRGAPAEAAAMKKKKKKTATSATKEQEGAEKEEGGAALSSSGLSKDDAASASQSRGVEEAEREKKEEGPVKDDTERLLAVGISLKKKDAERMCYLHAVDILRTLGQDVLTNYRAGLPRRKSLQQLNQSPTATPLSCSAESSEKNGKSADGSLENKEAQQHDVGSEKPSLPKPYMHKLMKQFMTSGRHYTAPKRRPSPGLYSPF